MASKRDIAKVLIHFFNVGQGNSICLECFSDAAVPKYILIDCHSVSKVNPAPPVLDFLIEKKVTTLSAVIITHLDADHYFGLSKVLEHFSGNGRTIEKLVQLVPFGFGKYKFTDSSSNATFVRKELAKIESLIQKLGIPKLKQAPLAWNSEVIFGDLNIQFLFPENKGCQEFFQWLLRVLEKLASSPSERGDNINWNHTTLVFQLRFGNACFFVGGDLVGGSSIYKGGKPLCADVVSVPHHGSNEISRKLWPKLSKPASSPTYPTYAIISAGPRNTYNHPHKNVIKGIINSGMDLYCINKAPSCEKAGLSGKSLHKFIKTQLNSGKSGDISGFIDSLGVQKDDICSGNISVELLSSGQARIFKRDSSPVCAVKQKWK
ncbi:MAG: MBL fold metallo-hydrolase [Elusimicrobiales bacterium]|nr:MBL fold metallo-hydrolase [Elusimicrobiales bacterium]